MDAFWCITLSILLVGAYIKRSRRPRPLPPVILGGEKTPPMTILTSESKEALETEIAKAEIERQKQRDIKDLQKKGYTAELISVIIPTIYPDDK